MSSVAQPVAGVRLVTIGLSIVCLIGAALALRLDVGLPPQAGNALVAED